MTIKTMVEKEVEFDAIRCALHVRHGEEVIPNDFPLRNGDMWNATIDIATGKIRDWPSGMKMQAVYMKVVDEGCYYLLAGDKIIAALDQEYVPGCIPGEYGDYVDFKIAPDGTIDRWSRFCTPEKIEEAFFAQAH
jgi:hypothetical protein